MPLQSPLFKGDPKLEACLIKDGAHILQGAVGDHVSKIQLALFMLDHLTLAAGELRGKKYGPSTAAAVLTFKKKRNIINRNYQTQADDIVGKMTIAELDKELVENSSTNGFGCVIAQHTDYLYASRNSGPKPSLQLGFLIAAATAVSTGTPQSDSKIMQDAFQDSRRTLREAVAKMDRLIAAINASRGAPLDARNLMTFLAVAKWLNINPKNPSAAVPTITSARDLMNRNLNLKTSTGADPPLQRGGPITLAGGVVTSDYHANSPGGPDRGTDCGDLFFNHDGRNCRRDVVTHEFFHMVGVHHGGGPSDGSTNRKNIKTPAQALDSADNLAQLVAQLTTHGGRTDACTRKHE